MCASPDDLFPSSLWIQLKNEYDIGGCSGLSQYVKHFWKFSQNRVHLLGAINR